MTESRALNFLQKFSDAPLLSFRSHSVTRNRSDRSRPPLPAALVRRRIGRVPSAKNDQVTLLGQATGIDSKRKMPMTLVLVMIFNILVALALGFVLGRIYQIRRDELERRDGFTLPPTARIPKP